MTEALSSPESQAYNFKAEDLSATFMKAESACVELHADVLVKFYQMSFEFRFFFGHPNQKSMHCTLKALTK
jgi:hypothetical protein